MLGWAEQSAERRDGAILALNLASAKPYHPSKAHEF
jgi:hypothetical protein